MDRILTLVAILAASTYMIYRLAHASRKRDDWRVFGLWLFTFCFVIGLAFRLEPVYQFTDSAIRIDNFSWLMSRIFLTLSVYLVASSSVRIFQEREFIWIRLTLPVVLIVFLIVFFYGLVNGLSYYHSDDLTPLHALAFAVRIIMLSYTAILILLPIRVFFRLLKTENASSARFRWGMLLIACLAALSLFSTKSVLSIVVQIGSPVTRVHHGLLLLVAVSQSLVLIWPLAFLPERFHTFLNRPVIFIRKAICLRDLNYLCLCFKQAGLSSHAMPMDSYWQHLRHLDRSIHHALVRILDCESILIALPDEAQSSSKGSCLRRQLLQLPHHRRMRLSSPAEQNSLQSDSEWRMDRQTGLDDFSHSGYDEQLKVYSQLSRQLRSIGFAKSNNHLEVIV